MAAAENLVPLEVLRADALTKMSAVERESVWHDIHCCPDMPTHDATSTASKLAEFDRALQHELLANDVEVGAAYRHAWSIDANYVKNPGLRLAFLKAERFNCRLAACRFLGFFDEKSRLWGVSRLCCTIKMDDFDSEDVETLRSGILQLLPHKDQSGRQIISHVITDHGGGGNEKGVVSSQRWLVFTSSFSSPYLFFFQLAPA
jgi:hypothetical protein